MTVGIVLSDQLPAVDTVALGDLMNAALGLDETRGDHLSIARMPLMVSVLNTLPVPTEKGLLADANSSRTSPMAVNVWRSFPSWAIAGAMLLIGLLVILLKMRSKRVPARLSAAERQKLLGELQGWLAKDVREDVL